jgi:hypothetical protein
LYGAYCLTSLFLSGIIIASIGTKWGLVCGLTHYTAYLLAAYVAMVTGDEVLFIAGAAFGGMGSGYLWVCQGSYFTESAQAYAAASDENVEAATGMFASMFATVYLILEVGVKLLGSAVKQAFPGDTGTEAMYLIFMLAGVISCIGMSRVDDLRSEARQHERKSLSCDLVFAQASGAFRLLISDARMGLLIPTQVAFAVVAAFLGSWITPQVLGKAIGNEMIGYYLVLISTATYMVHTLIHPYTHTAIHHTLQVLPRDHCGSSSIDLVRCRLVYEAIRLAVADDVVRGGSLCFCSPPFRARRQPTV